MDAQHGLFLLIQIMKNRTRVCFIRTPNVAYGHIMTDTSDLQKQSNSSEKVNIYFGS
uniref:Uncharacterized protein n=1 Tax=Arundo donax TaxID=35708 RepID=A0A0A9EUH4_ARUDO